MKLIMTLLVKNEIDIIRENINFHLASGIDHLIITDNKSDDGTRDILSEYDQLNEITVIDEPGDDYSQYKWVTRMALLAGERHGADWIINNDADEFWIHPEKSLKEALEVTTSPVQLCARRNMVFPFDTPETGAHWVERLRYRTASLTERVPLEDPLHDPLPDLYFNLNLPGKAIVRSKGLLGIEQGNHSARFEQPVKPEQNEIVVYHFPVRSKQQFETKIRQGGQAYARNYELSEKVGWHWRRFYHRMEHEGLEAALQEALPTANAIQQGLGLLPAKWPGL